MPKDVVEKWLKHLRNEFPTVAFKACTQSQKHNLVSGLVCVYTYIHTHSFFLSHTHTRLQSQKKFPLSSASSSLLSSSACLGAEVLLKLLGNYCRNADIKTSISVGVVGKKCVGHRKTSFTPLLRCNNLIFNHFMKMSSLFVLLEHILHC